MLPCIPTLHGRDGYLHVRILAFGDQQPVVKSFELRQVQTHRRDTGGAIDAGDEPTPTGTTGENRNSARFAEEASCFVPAGRRVAQNLERLGGQ